MRTTLIATIGILLAGTAFYAWNIPRSDAPSSENTAARQPETTLSETSDTADTPSKQIPLEDGTYQLLPAESTFNWSGKKPLIDGYTNTGSIAFSGGSMSVTGGEVSGTVTLDMNTLVALGTPKKPGQEGALAEHLKGERWFDVATYPTAEVTLVHMVQNAPGAYEVTANLTMHGQTNEVTFPAEVTVDGSGRVTMRAQTEINRTLWGVTAGSDSFFDNLADNVIDDMIAISFTLIAQRGE